MKKSSVCVGNAKTFSTEERIRPVCKGRTQSGFRKYKRTLRERDKTYVERLKRFVKNKT